MPTRKRSPLRALTAGGKSRRALDLRVIWALGVQAIAVAAFALAMRNDVDTIKSNGVETKIEVTRLRTDFNQSDRQAAVNSERINMQQGEIRDLRGRYDSIREELNRRSGK